MGCTSSSTNSNTNIKDIKTTHSSSSSHSNSNSINEEKLNKIISINLRINPAEYRISSFIAAGGAGLVYSAVHHINNTKIAMKFFGYVEKSINIDEVFHEIELFSGVSCLNNVVQLKGVFIDSPAGYINNKVSKECYPVICMELMEGGDLFDRLQSRNTVSEKFVSRVFREILLALDSLHHIGYLHCDLKLENVMFSSLEDDAQVKLIDFGMMVRLPEEGVFYCETIHGTAGYVAPESIKKCQYSPKSDIWQAGCILYSLLSGFQAFHPHHPELIVQGKYMKMTGVGWDNISNEAKDLVAKIFTVDSEKRPSIQEILQHEWLGGAAPDTHMGEQYKQRIKQRALKQRMKNVVFDHDIIANNKETKEKLKRILPLVKPRQKQRRTRSSIIRGSVQPHPVNAQHNEKSNHSSRKTDINKNGNQLPQYRQVFSLDDIDLINRKRSQSIEMQDADFESKANDDFNVKISSLTSAFVQQTVEVARNQTSESLHNSSSEVAIPEIDLDTFVTVLRDCGLSELATPQMFHIFGNILIFFYYFVILIFFSFYY